LEEISSTALARRSPCRIVASSVKNCSFIIK
jgi:hypothetical protein